MPNTLQRYLLKQFFAASAGTILLFVFVLIVGNAIKDVLPLLASGKIDWMFFFDTLWHLIPSMIAYSLPLGLLTATLLVVGRLSSNNELLAMKASGIPLTVIIAPLLFIATCGTLFTLAVNFHWGPHSIVYYRKALHTLIRQKPLQFIPAGTFVDDFPGYLFYIEKKHHDWVENCWLWELDELQPSGVNLFLYAKKGLMRYDPQKHHLIFTLLKGSGEKYITHAHSFDAQPIGFDSTEIALPLSYLLGDNALFHKRLGYMTLQELLHERDQVAPTLPIRERQTHKIASNLEIQRNVVFSFGILSMVLMAIPLGIKLHRTETSTNLVLAIAIAMGFHFILMATSWLETIPHTRPDYLVWIPHLALLGCSFCLLKRASRY